MMNDDCPTPDGHDTLTLKRSENDEQVDDVAEIPKLLLVLLLLRVLLNPTPLK